MKRAVLVKVAGVCVAGVAVTAALFVVNRENQFEKQRVRFLAEAAKVRSEFLRELDAYVLALRSAQGLFAASKSVERSEWREFAAKLLQHAQVQGAVSYTYVASVAKSELDDYLARVRADDAPSFEIRGDVSQDRLAIVQFAEPAEIQADVLGRNVWEDLRRKESQERARDLNLPTFATSLRTEPSLQEQEMLLIELPIYGNGTSLDTVEQRRAATLGWVVSQMRMDTIVKPLLESYRKALDLHVEDVTPQREVLVLGERVQGEHESPLWVDAQTVDVYGQLWRIEVKAFPSFLDAQDSQNSWVLLISGLIGTALLGALIASLAGANQRAEAIAAQMTRSLSRSEQVFRSLARYSPVGIFLTDENGNCTYVNEKWCELGGISAEQAAGDGWARALHPDDRDRISRLWKESAERGHSFSAEYRFRTPQGKVHLLAGNAAIIRDESENIQGFVGTVFDISAIREAQEKMERFFDLSPDLMCVAGFDGYLKKINDSFSAVLGWGREELLARPFLEFVHSEDRQQTDSEQGLLAAGKVTHHFTNRYLCRDGSYRWLQWNAFPVQDLGIIYAVARDVTEQRSVQERLQQSAEEAHTAAKAKAQFLANMSHEIRTPLNGIIGLASLLQESALSAEQREQVETLVRAGNTLLAIVNDVLDFSKFEAGKLELEKIPYSVEEAVRDVVSLLKPSAEAKNIELVYCSEGELPATVYGDSNRLRQVLSNLISNAIKFCSRGVVRVLVKRLPMPSREEVIRFEVIDSGIGISAKTIPFLFREFTQADASTTRRFGGTGLGLAICKRIVEKMGGEIGVESEEGKGSTFWFTIPFEKAPSNLILEKTEKSKPENREALPVGLRVLLAEDNATNQIVTKRVLEKLGCKVVVAENGRDALAALEAHEFDVVLMDCHMPVMEGFEATRHIRRMPGWRGKVPILALTASVGGNRQSCIDAGMDDYLSKPVQTEDLRRALARWAKPPVQTTEVPALDPEAFRKLLDLMEGGDDSFVNEVLETFASSAASQMESILRAVKESDAEALRKAAHTLKGASANIGALTLSKVCKRFEDWGKSNDTPSAVQALPELESEFARVRAEIGKRRGAV